MNNSSALALQSRLAYDSVPAAPVLVEAGPFASEHAVLANPAATFAATSPPRLDELDPCAERSPLLLRAYRPQDRSAVTSLLADLPRLYPGGDRWLKRRLGDVEANGATCRVVCEGRAVVGVLIETPKADGRLKVSTLWVAPGYRRRGVATALLGERIVTWARERPRSVYCTADLASGGPVVRLLRSFGFASTALEMDRYGLGRHELVLTWSPPPPPFADLGGSRRRKLRASSPR